MDRFALLRSGSIHELTFEATGGGFGLLVITHDRHERLASWPALYYSVSVQLATPRSQFDPQLLRESIAEHLPVCRNHGRQVVSLADGTVATALSWGGAKPVLKTWLGHKLLAEHPLDGSPSAPCLLAGTGNGVELWLSVGEQVCHAKTLSSRPEPVAGVTGELLDAVIDPHGGTILALRSQNRLQLLVVESRVSVNVDEDTGRASLECDEAGHLHVVYEKQWRLECRMYDVRKSLTASSQTVKSERIAEPFASHPVIVAHGDDLIVAYLGDSWPRPEGDEAFWADRPWNRRIGLSGYIAALVCDNGKWSRHRIANTKQFAKPLWPKRPNFRYDYPSVDVRVRLDHFGPPSLVVGPDRVPQVYWANTERRWEFGSRFLGDAFTPPAEVRGPMEQLSEAILVPKQVPADASAIPIASVTTTRTYLDTIACAPRRVRRGRRIDFLQPDELAIARGLSFRTNPMRRYAGNPVLRVGPKGSTDDGGISVKVFQGRDGWRAEILAKQSSLMWKREYPATSQDGITWKRGGPIPDDATGEIEGVVQPLNARSVRFMEDRDEPNLQHRFKGVWLKPGLPWGTYLPVTSPDENVWSVVKDATPVMTDEDPYLWKDNDDIPERRYKMTGCARSFCGRVCALWTSPDGLHWNDIHHALDWHNPFGSEPYWWEDYPRGGIGRLAVEPWAGPDDEEEIHSGFMFRDGERWLMHYMKWTPDGHVFPALASSRDGLNFTRVGGGAPTLPLGEPGTWETGRIAFRNPPYRVGDAWRQYYTGSSWKHGMGGTGKRPHPSTRECACLSPMQTGIAEIPVGHWGHLELDRNADEGTLITIPLHLESPHRLSLDVDGLEHPHNAVRCALIDHVDGTALKGFEFPACDPIPGNGPRVPVAWNGRGLESLGKCSVRIGVRLVGHRVKLFGLNLSLAGALQPCP